MRIRRIEKRFKNALTGIWIEENGQLPFWNNFIASRRAQNSNYIVQYTLECYLGWLESLYFGYSGFIETGHQNCSFAEYVEYEYPSK